MDKNRPNGEHNLVEWARPHLGERRRFYKLIDPRLEGHFSIKGAQKAAQLAARCLSRDPKVRPMMSDVVEALKPLPNLKDMASSSYYFQTMQADRIGSSPNTRNVLRTQGSFSRNGQQQHPRSLSIPNGSHASPYRHQLPQNSPNPNGKPQNQDSTVICLYHSFLQPSMNIFCCAHIYAWMTGKGIGVHILHVVIVRVLNYYLKRVWCKHHGVNIFSVSDKSLSSYFSSDHINRGELVNEREFFFWLLAGSYNLTQRKGLKKYQMLNCNLLVLADGKCTFVSFHLWFDR